MMYFIRVLGIILFAFLISGCTNLNDGVLDVDGGSQVNLRNLQSRIFETTDKQLVLKNVIATLQDLDFVLDNANKRMGIISATKFYYGREFKATVTVKKHGKKRMIVRLNARYGVDATNDPKIFQDFFNALSKAMFLEANAVS